MFWPLVKRKPIKFDPIEDKWQITAHEAIEKYGTALEVLKELNKDNKISDISVLSVINAIAILELDQKLKQIEKLLTN